MGVSTLDVGTIDDFDHFLCYAVSMNVEPAAVSGLYPEREARADGVLHDWSDVRKWPKDWIAAAYESGIDELYPFARDLGRRRQGIFVACDYGSNSSMIEGMNNLAKTFKKVAFGFMT